MRHNREKVALRKESVDRNIAEIEETITFYPSLSARRAWIEMHQTQKQTQRKTVALRKESVDRNTRCASNRLQVPCRSPQGAVSYTHLTLPTKLEV